MTKFIPGQRWVSEAEPELGLGMVLRSSSHQVTVLYRASGTTRVYSIENAPLKRVRFREGETIRTSEDKSLQVSQVTEENGLLVYHTNSGSFQEPLLSDQMNLNTPRVRLLAGHVDSSQNFDLRFRCWQFWHRLKKSAVRGFVGGRITLVPHQLYIANEVANRLKARVLLADEVGLGKTIESCLVLHRLLLSGRAGRVLILVPESLVHQWFVELYRRFNTWFAIFDEERCESIEENDPESNPFQDDQLVIASIDLLSQNERRLAQAAGAEWDLLVVDEAHHLRWSPEQPSPEYNLVEILSRKTPHVLLLTATPEQLGEASHWARLRLLDPERFADFERYLEEHARYEQVAAIVGKMRGAERLTTEEMDKLASSLKISAEQLRAKLETAEGRFQVSDQLLDQHGLGRVMFRNSRLVISGFPRRISHLYPLEPGEANLEEAWRNEFLSDVDPHLTKPNYLFKQDPRILWLADFLKSNPTEKILLLCRYREKVEAIEAALRERINAKIALFHEKLPLIQRDRNAAWFSEEDGAQLLLCSEIGSEGRNFQFAHHLVLFDLPLSPELLEQRIGRLDRIGQAEEIHIHVPYPKGTPQEILARWYQEGMNAFEQYFSGGAELFEAFSERVRKTAFNRVAKELKALITETKEFRTDLADKLKAGRDRLLEMHSFNEAKAGELVAQISAWDQDTHLDKLLLDLLDHFGIHVEELGNRSFNLGGGDLFKDKLPGLPQEGLTASANREKALAREDIAFLSSDHPILTSLMDMLLGGEHGNTAVALWGNAPTAGVMVEAVYILDSMAPASLQMDRFLPPTPIRILLTHKRKELTEEIPPELLQANLINGKPSMLESQMEELGSLLPGMIHVTEIIANKRSKPLVEAALAEARERFGKEMARLDQLQQQSGQSHLEEISEIKSLLCETESRLGTTSIRLDAVRLILAKAAPAAAPA